MKTLPLKSLTITEIENPKTGEKEPVIFKYSKSYLDALDKPPEGGFALADIRKRNRIANIIEAAVKDEASSFELEDDDANALRACVEAVRWAGRSEAIVEFLEDVLEATK